MNRPQFADWIGVRLHTGRSTIAVWDPYVRIFHWALVGSLAVALATTLILPPGWTTAHVIAGTTAAGLVVVRIVWAFLGPGPARFSGFVPGPRAVLEHLWELKGGHGQRHLGHNPLGALMILALLVTVLAVAVTGAVALGGAFKSGPFAFLTSFAVGRIAWELHSLLAYGLLLLIGLHVAGAIFESRRTGENLIRSMVDGRKEVRAGDAPLPQRTARPMLAAAAAVVLLAGSTVLLTGLAARPGLGVPTQPLNPVYASECGACHVPYHPSLAPAATWKALMANLSNHFGEDASLDPQTSQKILAYLTANSSGAFDTLAAHVFRTRNPDNPLSITATPFWQRRHRHIPDSVFASQSVVSRGNCQACHADAATGRFALSQVHIPEDAEP